MRSPHRFNRHLLIAVIAFAAISSSVVAEERWTEADLVVVRSANPVTETMDKLEGVVRSKGATVFARIDHAAGAATIDQELRPTQLLIFGNPRLGTPLMQSSQAAGLELPLRVLVFEAADGQTYMAYPAPVSLAARYGIADRGEIIDAMTKALRGFTEAAAR